MSDKTYGTKFAEPIDETTERVVTMVMIISDDNAFAVLSRIESIRMVNDDTILMSSVQTGSPTILYPEQAALMLQSGAFEEVSKQLWMQPKPFPSLP